MIPILWASFLAVAIGLSIWISFAHWKRKALVQLESGANLVNTSRGPIECAVLGEGPAVLISHGVMGGYDQGLAVIASGFFGDSAYRFIALSRPGYLRTLPEVGRTPEEQADSFAALLDSLRIEKVVVAGISGGGPPSLQFALRHSDRCEALLLISAVTERLPQQKTGKFALLLRAILLADFPAWLALGLASRVPSLGFRAILSSQELQKIRAPKILKNLLRVTDSTAPISVRRIGVMIDGQYLTTLPAYRLGLISVPTLVIHGTSDNVVPFASSERTATAIPGARLLAVENGSHFACLLGRSDVSSQVQKFLQEVLSR